LIADLDLLTSVQYNSVNHTAAKQMQKSKQATNNKQLLRAHNAQAVLTEAAAETAGGKEW